MAGPEAMDNVMGDPSLWPLPSVGKALTGTNDFALTLLFWQILGCCSCVPTIGPIPQIHVLEALILEC